MAINRIAIAAAAVVIGMGTLGAGVGYADPSAGTTGHDRACQVHTQNKGKSVAKGLDCTPAPTFSAVVGPDTFGRPAACDVTFTGSGLQPEAIVFWNVVGGTTVAVQSYDGTSFTGPLTVAADGTLNETTMFGNLRDQVVFHVEAPDGSTVSFSITVSC